MHLVRHKSALENRIHSTLINFGRPCPVTDLFGAEGRSLLARLPRPWIGRRDAMTKKTLVLIAAAAAILLLAQVAAARITVNTVEPSA
jgi:hypothetical protein